MIGREFREQATPYLSGAKPAFATSLVGILLKAYGAAALNWDGLTVQLQLKDDFELEMPRKVHDQMMGLILCMTSDRVFTEVPVFDEMVSALTGQGVGYEQDCPPVQDVAWTVTEILLNDPTPTGRPANRPWSRDIAKYVRVVLDDEGMPIAPKALDFAGDKEVPTESTAGEDYYAAVWETQSERAKEVDEWVQERVTLLVGQLEGLGIPIGQLAG